MASAVLMVELEATPSGLHDCPQLSVELAQFTRRAVASTRSAFLDLFPCEKPASLTSNLNLPLLPSPTVMASPPAAPASRSDTSLTSVSSSPVNGGKNGPACTRVYSAPVSLQTACAGSYITITIAPPQAPPAASPNNMPSSSSSLFPLASPPHIGTRRTPQAAPPSTTRTRRAAAEMSTGDSQTPCVINAWLELDRSRLHFNHAEPDTGRARKAAAGSNRDSWGDQLRAYVTHSFACAVRTHRRRAEAAQSSESTPMYGDGDDGPCSTRQSTAQGRQTTRITRQTSQQQTGQAGRTPAQWELRGQRAAPNQRAPASFEAELRGRHVSLAASQQAASMTSGQQQRADARTRRAQARARSNARQRGEPNPFYDDANTIRTGAGSSYVAAGAEGGAQATGATSGPIRRERGDASSRPAARKSDEEYRQDVRYGRLQRARARTRREALENGEPDPFADEEDEDTAIIAQMVRSDAAPPSTDPTMILFDELFRMFEDSPAGRRRDGMTEDEHDLSMMMFGLQVITSLSLGHARADFLSPVDRRATDSRTAHQRAALSNAVSELPTRYVTVAVAAELTAAEAECSVCLEGYVVGQQVMELPCQHKLHGSCGTKWLSENGRGTCPMCRASVM